MRKSMLVAVPNFHVGRAKSGHEIRDLQDAIVRFVIRGKLVQCFQERVDLTFRDAPFLVFAEQHDHLVQWHSGLNGRFQFMLHFSVHGTFFHKALVAWSAFWKSSKSIARAGSIKPCVGESRRNCKSPPSNAASMHQIGSLPDPPYLGGR